MHQSKERSWAAQTIKVLIRAEYQQQGSRRRQASCIDAPALDLINGAH